jgi:aldose 1-epimerase
MRALSVYTLLVAAILLISCTPTKQVTPLIEKSIYATLPDGRVVSQFTLRNASGCSANIITYGATVTSLRVPDRNGKLADVVLGYDSLKGYVEDKSYFGAIVGRYGNRIGKGRFAIDGKKYQLTVNDGENHLHGGKVGFHKVLWDATVLNDSKEPTVAFRYVSKAGDEGYPGNVILTATYSLTNANELVVEYAGTTDAPTILNPTHHSYFNLTGDFNKTILNHQLMIEADMFTPVDRELITTGVLEEVKNTPMDFRTPTAIGAHINENMDQLDFGKGYDHNWVIRGERGKVRKAAELYDPASGRVLTVLTDQPGLQFYSGNFLDGSTHGKGVAFQHRTGLCLEAQCYPDSPNKPTFPSVVLQPGETYKQKTIYKFSSK